MWCIAPSILKRDTGRVEEHHMLVLSFSSIPTAANATNCPLSMACFNDSTTSNASCFVGVLLSGIAVMFVIATDNTLAKFAL
jgi:hypothetical protein